MNQPRTIPAGFAPGVYPDISNEAHHADPAISSSQLVRYLDESAQHFRNEWVVTAPAEKDEEEEKSDALRIGSAMHCWLLEPDQFEQRYLVLPEGTNLRTNAGKDLRDDLAAQAAARGGALLKFEERRDIMRMANALGAQEVILGGRTFKLRDLFRHGRPEVSYFWQDPVTGMNLRARADWLIETPHLNLIIDYKTTRSAKRGLFERDAGARLYWMRQAVYQDGAYRTMGKPFEYLLVAQEKTGPMLGQAFTYEPDRVSWGRELYRETLLKIRRNFEEDKWPGYPPQIQRLEVPSWMLREFNLLEIASGEVVPQYLSEDGY